MEEESSGLRRKGHGLRGLSLAGQMETSPICASSRGSVATCQLRLAVPSDGYLEHSWVVGRHVPDCSRPGDRLNQTTPRWSVLRGVLYSDRIGDAPISMSFPAFLRRSIEGVVVSMKSRATSGRCKYRTTSHDGVETAKAAPVKANIIARPRAVSLRRFLSEHQEKRPLLNISQQLALNIEPLEVQQIPNPSYNTTVAGTPCFRGPILCVDLGGWI